LYHKRNDIGCGYKTHGCLVDNRDVVPYWCDNHIYILEIWLSHQYRSSRFVRSNTFINIFTKDMIVQLCNLVVNQMRSNNTLTQDMLVLLKQLGIYKILGRQFHIF
jgi:hypothetical protein